MRLFQAFLTQLVCNLLDEGNCCFRDGDWRQATQQYGEGISVARYAQAEALVIPPELLECLYVNRAAAFYQMVREKGKEGMLRAAAHVGQMFEMLHKSNFFCDNAGVKIQASFSLFVVVISTYQFDSFVSVFLKTTSCPFTCRKVL